MNEKDFIFMMSSQKHFLKSMNGLRRLQLKWHYLHFFFIKCSIYKSPLGKTMK